MRKAAAKAPYPFGVTRMVLLRLADLANEKNSNELWIGQGELATEFRCGRKAVGVAFKTISADGWLVLLHWRVKGRKNRYRFQVPSDASSGLITPDERCVLRTHVMRPQDSCDASSEDSSKRTTLKKKNQLSLAPPTAGEERVRTVSPPKAGADNGNDPSVTTLVDALHAGCRTDSAKISLRAERDYLNAADQLVAWGAKPDEVVDFADALRGRFSREDMVTAKSIVAHWHERSDPDATDPDFVPRDVIPGRAAL
jgi:hypothetical protein